MTETEIKLKDARIQLDLAMLPENILNIDIVRSCINAFISNARSVTLTMQKEFTSSPKFSKWYSNKKKEMETNTLLIFFNKQRVISIHKKSIQPNQRTINITKTKIGDQTATKYVAIVYLFDNFNKLVPGDTGNVFRLCEQYYDYLSVLLNEWLSIIK